MRKVKLTEAAETGPHHRQKELELQLKLISMQARVKRGYLTAPRPDQDTALYAATSTP